MNKPIEQIRKMIGNGDHEMALNSYSKIVGNSEYLNDALLLKSRYSTFRKEKFSGVYSNTEEGQKLNRIVRDFLDSINRYESNKLSISRKNDQENLAFNIVKTGFELASGEFSRMKNEEVYKKAKKLFPSFVNEKGVIFKKLKGASFSEIEYYKTIAEAESSKSGRNISAVELIEEEINRNKYFLLNAKKSGKEISIKQKIENLKNIQYLLDENDSEENEWIKKDMLVYREMNIDVKSIPISPVYDGNFTNYQNNGTLLRVGTLRPNTSEEVNKATLIYEKYDLKNKKVKLIYLYYKIWDKENKILNFRKANIINDSEQLINDICNKEYCACNENDSHKNQFPIKFNYRFPHCALFLRPTNRIQDNNRRLLSKGIYFPMCQFQKLFESEYEVLHKKMIEGSFLTHEMFEKLFQNEQIGSRWLEFSELKKLYTEKRLIDKNENLILYIQDVEEIESE